MLKAKFDDFETQRQSDEYIWFNESEEIIPEEYDDWTAWCIMGMYAND